MDKKQAINETVSYARERLLQRLPEFDEAIRESLKEKLAKQALDNARKELNVAVNTALTAKMAAGASSASISYEESLAAFPELHKKIELLADQYDAICRPAGRAGRPAELTGGRRVNVYLDAASLQRASKLGKGNVSEGIRIALNSI